MASQNPFAGDDMESDDLGFDWNPAAPRSDSLGGSLLGPASSTSAFHRDPPTRDWPKPRVQPSTRLDVPHGPAPISKSELEFEIASDETSDFSVGHGSAGFEFGAFDPAAAMIDSLIPPGTRLPQRRIAKPTLARPSATKTAVQETKDRPRGGVGPIRFPKVGDSIGGFRLISELGRGAFARVYHAADANLSDRSVALKVSKVEGNEPRILARLQHTHIVPIYSLHDDETTGLRLICMPYFGGANLAQLLDAAMTYDADKTEGKSLLDALDRVGKPFDGPTPRPSRSRGSHAPTPSTDRGKPASADSNRMPLDASQVKLDPPPGPRTSIPAKPNLRSLLDRLHFWSRTPDDEVTGQGPESLESDPELTQPNRRFLRGTSQVRASVWIVARLAEGLEHAHSRGLLHRDLKPSNILITADGTPMLLDFNLAADAPEVRPEEGERAKLGGTLPYMAPEHLDAFHPQGKTRPEEVDERSDVYALGLILYEMVAGIYPFTEPPTGLSTTAVLDYMLEERRRVVPSLREANPRVPWSLDAIVRKCMAPNPKLRYQSAREFGEELRRFLDDLPLKFTREPSTIEVAQKWARRNPKAASGASVALVSLCLLVGVGGIAATFSGHLQQVVARLNLRVFESGFEECQFLLNTTNGTDLTEHLRLGLDKAGEVRDRYEVGKVTDWTSTFWVRALSPDEQAEVRRAMGELFLLEARARITLANSEGEGARRKALVGAVRSLDQAEKFEPEPSHALLMERARYHTALGQADLAATDRARAAKITSRDARDLYLNATNELALGHLDVAESLLQEAVSLEPKRYWSWFTLGLCHMNQRRFNDAAGDFSVCTILVPKFAWSHLHRGKSMAQAGRLVEAMRAFDQALRLNPDFTEAYVNRGFVALELGDSTLAEADLRRSISLGRGDLIVRAGLAEALAKQGQDAEAVEILDHLITRHVDDPRLHVTRGTIRLKSAPELAAADFRAALSIDPGFAPAHFGLAKSTKGRDPVEALRHADAALKADPGLVDALELRALLRGGLGLNEAVGDVNRLLLTPNARRIYNAACSLSLLGSKTQNPGVQDRAVALLNRAIEAGFPASVARDDPDLKPLMARPDVRKLVGK